MCWVAPCKDLPIPCIHMALSLLNGSSQVCISRTDLSAKQQLTCSLFSGEEFTSEG